ncbi:MAG: hypothetical protein ACPLQP_04095, partial [Moorellaceae bacterium]
SYLFNHLKASLFDASALAGKLVGEQTAPLPKMARHRRVNYRQQPEQRFIILIGGLIGGNA